MLNLFNDDWGVKRYINTTDIGSAVAIVDADFDAGANVYNYNSFSEPTKIIDTFDSLYRIQLGIRADF